MLYDTIYSAPDGSKYKIMLKLCNSKYYFCYLQTTIYCVIILIAIKMKCIFSAYNVLILTII